VQSKPCIVMIEYVCLSVCPLALFEYRRPTAEVYQIILHVACRGLVLL